jgi:hypothetical protein
MSLCTGQVGISREKPQRIFCVTAQFTKIPAKARQKYNDFHVFSWHLQLQEKNAHKVFEWIGELLSTFQSTSISKDRQTDIIV